MLCEQTGQLGLAAFIQQLSRGAGLGAVHAHVQGGVEAITEASFRPVKLRRADPEIEQGT